ESRVKLRGAARTPPAAPAAPAPAARSETQMAVIPRDTALSAATPARAPAPQAAFGMVDGALVEKASPISLDSARALLGADPLAVPGAPRGSAPSSARALRSEEHTSELQSPCNL